MKPAVSYNSSFNYGRLIMTIVNHKNKIYKENSWDKINQWHRFISVRQHIICYSALYAIAHSSVCLSVRLFIRLSDTRVDQSNTVEDRIIQPSPQNSPKTLVS